METRKLASIQYIHHITPIEGADKIECVHVLGWQCVGKKGQFEVGQKCVYMEVDSFLPICEQFEFLRGSSYRNTEIMGEGFRLKTQNFRGQISQGLVMPLDILPAGKEYEIGEDVTELLGIKKWEVEERTTNSGTVIGEFPDDMKKTDELRVQSYPALIDEFKAVPEYYISTKMDGSSFTMYLRNGKFGVCSRNCEFADDGKSDVWKYAHAHRIHEKLVENGYDNIVIQGEWCGPGILKNRLKLVRPEWYVFSVSTLPGFKRCSLDFLLELCDKLGLEHVPIEERGRTFPYDSVEQLIERAKGKYSCGSQKEGIVIRPTEAVYSPTIQTVLSMKVLNNNYLLKE